MYQSIQLFPTGVFEAAKIAIAKVVREEAFFVRAVGVTLPDACVAGQMSAETGRPVLGKAQPCERPASSCFALFEPEGYSVRVILQGMCDPCAVGQPVAVRDVQSLVDLTGDPRVTEMHLAYPYAADLSPPFESSGPCEPLPLQSLSQPS